MSTLAFIARHPLNRGRKTRAISDYFRWQIGSRLVPGQIIHDWINGARIIVRPGETGVTGNMYCSLHDFADMGYLLHVLRPDDLFVDIGANSGSYTILACAAKGAQGICFEPVPSTFDRLLDNLRINNLSGRVDARNIGLSDREAELSFTSDEDTANHIVADGEGSSGLVRVKVLPLDEVIDERTPAMMKIDVEGFETPVLAGARRTLAKQELRSVIMELNGSGRRYGYEDKQIIASMADFGFSTFSYDPFSRALNRINGDNCSSGNTLFVRDERAVQERLKQAPPVLVGSVWI